MILVTLGTQDKKFDRLLIAIQKLIDSGEIKDKVIVQAGCTSDFKSNDMEIFDLIPMDEFDKLISECDVLITHGGVGSIISGLKNNKKVIAAPRLKKYGEHTNDHQLQIIENFSKEGYILALNDFNKLDKILKNLKEFHPKQYKSNNDRFLNLVENSIDGYLNKKKDKKKDKKKIIDSLFLILIFIYILASLLISIVFPQKIINNENRYANRYTSIGIRSYLNGSMQTNIENTLSDQIVFSSELKKGNNFLSYIYIKSFLDSIIAKNGPSYYSLDGIFAYDIDNLVYYPYSFDDIKAKLDSKIDLFNKTMELYPNVEYYFYYIEKDTDICFDDNSKLLAYEYIKNKLNCTNIKRFKINNFEEFEKYFFKTDHHWNYEGSYKGYLEVLELLGLDNVKEISETKCFGENFVGSKGNPFGGVYHEKFCAYIFNYDDIETKINGVSSKYGHQDEYLSSDYSAISYGDYYGWDDGEIIFDTHDNSKDNILIIGESFDNAILRLLAENFNKTISIDLRNYKYNMNKSFNFEDYLKKYSINKVLFIGNINYWLSDEFKVIE